MGVDQAGGLVVLVAGVARFAVARRAGRGAVGFVLRATLGGDRRGVPRFRDRTAQGIGVQVLDAGRHHARSTRVGCTTAVAIAVPVAAGIAAALAVAIAIADAVAVLRTLRITIHDRGVLVRIAEWIEVQLARRARRGRRRVLGEVRIPNLLRDQRSRQTDVVHLALVAAGGVRHSRHHQKHHGQREGWPWRCSAVRRFNGQETVSVFASNPTSLNKTTDSSLRTSA